jgi:DNA-binding LacI/PurR family transcriptional regulator
VISNRKPITIRDLAGVLGMPKSTVSTALSGKGTLSTATRQKVLAAAHELGYRPNALAQRLAQGETHAVVCIVSGPLDIGIGTQKITLIQQELAARSLEVPLYTYAGPGGDAGESHVTQIQQICRQRPRAIVCAGRSIHPTAFPELEAYQREGGIVVSYDLPAPLHCDQVIFDREDNAYQAARHLLESGHRRIGIGMSLKSGWSAETDELPQDARLQGFRRALEEFGAPFHREWLFPRGRYVHGGEEMARRFLAMTDRPSGLCIVNDFVALAFMDDVIRAGVRVPEDLSIVSHDNEPIAAHCPVPMTSVSHPAEEIARRVIDLVMERIDGYEGTPRTITIKGELAVRRSVASPPAR